MASPAEILELIIRSEATTLGYATFIGHLQDMPDRAILLIDKAGQLDPRTLAGNQTGRELVEIHVRGVDYADSAAVLPFLWEDVFKITRATSAYGKIVQAVTMANKMGCLGQEPQTRRWRFSQNFLVTIR